MGTVGCDCSIVFVCDSMCLSPVPTCIGISFGDEIDILFQSVSV